MTKQNILKKDYILLLLLSVLYFLSIQKVIPNFVYLIIALINSFYFFPIKLFLDKSLFTGPMKRKVIKVFSYFIISSIIVFSALLFYTDDGNNFIRTTLFVYGMLNLILLFYFYFTENISSSFILSVCTSILVSATTSL